MRKLLFILFASAILPLIAEVYDCFTFFNELELLRLRMEELNDVVDHFVLVESPISFTGKSKPLYFQENAVEFDKFKHKIIHVVIPAFPNLTGDEEKDHWHRESYSRDAILRGLTNCQPEDVIFISDVDEIPRAEAVLRIKRYLSKYNHLPQRRRSAYKDSELVCGLRMRLFMYAMNRENLDGWYGGSKATPYWMVEKHTPWGIKLFHHKHSMIEIQNAGWHFNTMGGANRSLYKWLFTGPIYYPGNENALLELGERPDLLQQSYQGQVDTNTVRVQIDSGYPRYFLDHLQHFHDIGWLDE